MFDQSKLKKQSLTFAKYLIALSALAWISYTIDITTTINNIESLSLLTLVFLMVASVASVIARAAMWYPLVRYFGRSDITRLVKADLVILFANSLLPSRISGRSIAPIALRNFTGLAWSQAVAATVVHTGIYAVLYGLVGLLGWGIDMDSYGPELTLVILLSISLYLIVGAAIVLAGWRLDILDQIVNRIARLVTPLPAGSRISGTIDSLRSKLLDGSNEQFQLLVGNPSTIGLFVVAWMIAVVLMPAVRIGILLSAMAITEINLLLLPLYTVVAYSVTVLPLTPGGIGVAEATGVAVFLALGAPEGAVVTIIFLDRLFGVYLPSLFGWVPLVRTDLREVID